MDLPASIEAAWGLRERPQRGPKPGLSHVIPVGKRWCKPIHQPGQMRLRLLDQKFL